MKIVIKFTIGPAMRDHRLVIKNGVSCGIEAQHFDALAESSWRPVDPEDVTVELVLAKAMSWLVGECYRHGRDMRGSDDVVTYDIGVIAP